MKFFNQILARVSVSDDARILSVRNCAGCCMKSSEEILHSNSRVAVVGNAGLSPARNYADICLRSWAGAPSYKGLKC